MSYSTQELYDGGAYSIIDDTDGQRIARVTTFLPGPLISVEGVQHLYPPNLARVIAQTMLKLADEIEGNR